MTTDEYQRPDVEAQTILMRLKRSALRGQPLMPLIFSDPLVNLLASKLNRHPTSIIRKPSLYWESPHSVVAPTTIINSKNLHTVRRLIVKKWAPRLRSGRDVLKDVLSHRCFLPTGFKQLDDILSGGVMSGEITEIFGPSAVGKSQICHFIAAATVCKHFSRTDYTSIEEVDQSKGATVLVIDTKGDFFAQRLQQIIYSNLIHLCQKNTSLVRQLANQCLSRVQYRLVADIQQFTDVLIETRMRLYSSLAVDQGETPKNFSTPHIARTRNVKDSNQPFYSRLKLIIIDCITTPFMPFTSDFAPETISHLMNIVAELKRMTGDLHVAIVLTNNLKYQWESEQPCLGCFWSRVPHLSLSMSQITVSPFCSSVKIFKSQRQDLCPDEKNTDKPVSCQIDFSNSWPSI